MVTIIEYQWIYDMFADMSERKIMEVSVNDVRLYSLIYCMSRSGRQCTISQKKMAQRLQMSRNTINQCLKKLEKAHLCTRSKIKETLSIYSYRAIVPETYLGDAMKEDIRINRALQSFKEEGISCEGHKKKERVEKQKLYYNAQEVGDILGISKSSAYVLIRGWNQELESGGWLVIAGKVPIAFFEDKVFMKKKEKTE